MAKKKRKSSSEKGQICFKAKGKQVCFKAKTDRPPLAEFEGIDGMVCKKVKTKSGVRDLCQTGKGVTGWTFMPKEK